MLYPKNKEAKLSKELFENPTSEYRGTPFWSWNCKVTEELVRDQMEVFQKMGFGGAHLHARTGLETEYMGEEFLNLVQYADEEAKKRSMLCWLYDEDRFPSGAAGGIVTENWDYRCRYLLLTREKKEGMCDSKDAFLQAIKDGKKPAGYYLTAYRILTKEGRIVSYRRIPGGPVETDSLEETRKEGRLWLAYVELMRESPWYNDQTYVDTMNKKAIERFIEVTHERYYEKLGTEFGKSIPAIFTDEPQMRGSLALPDGESEADVTLSFTDDLPDTYKEKYGVDLLDVIPELLWELQEGEVSAHRYQYHDHLTERFVSAFTDTIGDWCEKHDLAMTGHYMSEPSLYSQTLRLGEAMRCYRGQQLPGIDILCGDPEYSTAKQCVSVARQYGREGVLSEIYGVNHWDLDFKGHKLQGDWLAALGVTIRVPHLSFMSMEGESKRDWPASISYQSPWWNQYSYIENYFSRVNTAMTRGNALVNVAVIHPIESYWLYYGPVAETGGLREQMDEQFSQMIRWMLYGLIDFDFLSEGLLPDQKPEVLNNGILQVGNMQYKTILVPGLATIRSTTLDMLEQFAAAGGRVIFMGEIPKFVDARKSDRARILASGSECINTSRFELLEALRPDRELEIRSLDGKDSDNLFYQMRQDGDDRWLFVCHVNRKRNRVDQPDRIRICLKGTWDITCYDALTGEIREQTASYKDGKTIVKLDWFAEDSLLWKLSNRPDIPESVCCHADTSVLSQNAPVSNISAQTESVADDSAKTASSDSFPVPTGKLAPAYILVAGAFFTAPKQPKVLQTITRPASLKLEEPNVLLLDRASWKLDDQEWQPEEEILRLDNQIRSIVHYPHRQDAYTQPWRIKHAPTEHLVTLRYEIQVQNIPSAVKLAMERPQNAAILLNGIPVPSDEDSIDGWFTDKFIRTLPLPKLKEGINELVLQIPYGRKTNLENIFILGDFGVKAAGMNAVIINKEKDIWFGSVTDQGMPFYGGTMTYTMSFTLEEQQSVSVRVPHFSSPVLGISVDGISKGLIAFAPHVCQLGTLSAGTHSLEITVFGNRFNSFGTLHNSNDEFKWYGPDSYRTTGSQWSETWQLRPFGILSRVEILETE